MAKNGNLLIGESSLDTVIVGAKLIVVVNIIILLPRWSWRIRLKGACF